MNESAKGRFRSLALHLEILASETRLQLLHVLRTPRALHEIKVLPSMSRPGENPTRPLSRQAVSRHIEALADAGLVHRLPGARGDAYVLNHERLFAVVDDMRGLSKLRPFALAVPEGRTVPREDDDPARLPERPRLAVAYGRDDGVGFGLETREGATWRIGRAQACEIRLDYDPFLSAEHAEIRFGAGAFAVTDSGSRNGSWVNWERLPPHSPRTLRPGDLLITGRTVLAFQP